MGGRDGQFRRDVAVSFVALLGLLAGHSILETARDTLFLSRLSADRLPVVYLAIAAVAVGAAQLNRRVMARIAPQTVATATLLGAAGVTVGCWFAVSSGHPAALYALYVWTGAVATLAVSQIWSLVGARFNVAQAKRGFAIIGAGGLVGATAGSAAAGLLLEVIAPDHLLLAAAGLFALTAVVPTRLQGGGPVRDPVRRKPATGDGDSGKPYLRRLLVIVAVTAVTVTVADFLFKSVVAASIPARDLGTFFAFFYAGLNGIALVVQLFVASWLLERLGVTRALWVLPVVFAASALGFTATLALAPIVAMKAVDGSLRHSLHRIATELLYLPLPANLRTHHKTLVDAVGSRGGQAVGGAAMLAAVAAGAGPRHIAVAVVALSLVWLVAAHAIRRRYVQLFRERLRAGTIDTRAGVADLDLHSLEGLIAALSSPDERVVVSALELLHQSGRGTLIPALILHHPSAALVSRALAIMTDAGRDDFHPLARTLLRSIHPTVRAAALRAIGSGETSAEELRAALADTSASVRATAIVGLWSRGWATEEELATARGDLVNRGDAATRDMRLAFLSAVRLQPSAVFVSILCELASASDTDTRRAAAAAMSAQPSPAFLASLLPMLADREVRAAARTALVALGEPARARLRDAVTDTHVPRPVRLQIPRALAEFGDSRAASTLLELIDSQPDPDLRLRLLRAICRTVARNPRVALDRRVLDRHIAALLRQGIVTLSWRQCLEADVGVATLGGGLVADFVRDRERGLGERAFRFLGLRYPDEDFEMIHDGLRAKDDKTRANSAELLTHLVGRRMGEGLAAILADGPPGERLARATPYFRPPPTGEREVLLQLLRGQHEVGVALAVHRLAELQSPDLAEHIASIDTTGKEVLQEVIQQTRSRHRADEVPA